MNRTEITSTYTKLDVLEEIADYIKNVYILAEKRCINDNDEVHDYYRQYAESMECDELISLSGELTGNILSSFILWLHSEITKEIIRLEDTVPDILKEDKE